ncbi:hypothetical protein JCM19233_7114 [Vibrio astriarenae]|nr:hypothetical protein JCM19233_7114 [Vibrio sp. C7]
MDFSDSFDFQTGQSCSEGERSFLTSSDVKRLVPCLMAGRLVLLL